MKAEYVYKNCSQGKRCWPTNEIDYSCENGCRPVWRATGQLLNREALRRVFGKSKHKRQKEHARTMRAVIGRIRAGAKAKQEQVEAG